MTDVQDPTSMPVPDPTTAGRSTAETPHDTPADLAGLSHVPSPVLTPGAPNSALKEPPPKPEDGVHPSHPAAAHVVIIDHERGLVETRPARFRYAICGFASSSRGQIPVNDPAWEVWGINQLYRHIQRADRWFDIHKNWEEELVPGTDHRAWIRDCGIPVYMGAHHPELPTSVTYPIEALVAHFGADYFTSTIAYMVALAIYEIDQRVEASQIHGLDGNVHQMLEAIRALYGQYMIGLFGIDLIVGEEYFDQKPCAEFWLGQASARGITIYLPAESALCKTLYRYGYEKEPVSPLRLSDFAKARAELSKQKDDAVRQALTLDGALQRDEYWTQLLTLRLRGVSQL